MTHPLIEQIRAQMINKDRVSSQNCEWNIAIRLAADLVEAWLSSNPVGAVVKPLVWHSFDAWTYWAESTSGTYRVEERNGVWRATLNLSSTEHMIYEYTTDGLTPNDCEAAQLACQADHAARIMAALSSPPVAASITPKTVSRPEWDYFQGLVNIARRSAAKAKEKFPQPNYVTLKIAEEAGEVVRGAVHYAEGRMEWDEVQGEIIQLLAMLIRFVTEGDEVNGIKPPDIVTMKGMLK